ncbi:hypothetical protein DL96DRAFT_1818680 [Flagelloscypha sp. PMI_526]|nr:hypothetical protein DL96DRAFT_1818680 [Flagelloscypha sp. PMI_526]
MASSDYGVSLQLLAEVLLYYFISTLVIILSYGLYLPLFLKTVYLISPRLRSSVPSRWLLALVLVLFIPTTVHLVSGTFMTFTLLKFASIGNEDDSIADKLNMLWVIAQPASVAFSYTGQINILLIDVIVVWRAYALQPHRRWLRILLLTLLVFTLLFSAFLMIMSQNYVWQYSITEYVLYRLEIVRNVLSLFVTVIGAASIGWIAWEFRKSAKESQFRHRTTPFVSRTFRVLIEGCVILTFLQIAVISLDFKMMNPDPALTSPGSMLSMLLSEITIFASAIHPCLVTVLVSGDSYNAYSAVGVSEAKLSTFAAVPSTLSGSTV